MIRLVCRLEEHYSIPMEMSGLSQFCFSAIACGTPAIEGYSNVLRHWSAFECAKHARCASANPPFIRVLCHHRDYHKRNRHKTKSIAQTVEGWSLMFFRFFYKTIIMVWPFDCCRDSRLKWSSIFRNSCEYHHENGKA